MARIRQDDVEQVRERTNIVDVVQQYVGLKKAGRAFSGLCPFHTEKTPSFTVDPAKQVYYCFGCSQGGNVFHFLMAVEHLTFPEAVERLARGAGVTLRYEGLTPGDRRVRSRRDSLHRANQRAAELYHSFLLEAPEAETARKYLQSRGFSKEAVEEFGMGFAPRQPDFLLRRLSRELSPELLVEAGVALKDSSGTVRDRFRSRITFPVHDLAGRAVGFGARLLEGEGPKYLNSPETPVYRKGEMLFNLHRAKTAVASSGRAHVVEGYTDVIALHRGGVEAAVATCGTALSEGHMRLLSRFAEHVVLAFDSDEAGARAAERAYGFFEQFPVEVLVLVLPEGLDPADMVKEQGAEAFEKLAADAVPLIEYMIRRALGGKDLLGPEAQTRAVNEALPIVAGLEDPVRRSEYAGLLADLAGVSPNSVALSLDRMGRGSRASEPVRIPDQADDRQVRVPAREVEREALKLLLQHADTCEEELAALEEDLFSTERHRKVFSFVRATPGSPAELVERAQEEGLSRLLAELSVEPVRGEPTAAYAERVVSRLEEMSLRRRIDTIKKRLERLNPTKDPQSYDTLFEELIALEGERRKVRARAGEGV
jgi:DNA primase